MTEIDIRPGTPLGQFFAEAEERRRQREMLTSVMDRLDDARNVIAVQEGRITTLEARERRVREYLAECLKDGLSPPDDYDDGCVKTASYILAILNEGATE